MLFKGQAELNLQLKREEDFWRKKSGLEWFKDGERNTKFFHAVVKGRRSRLKITRIQNDEGEWMENQADIAEEAVSFFQRQFTKEAEIADFTC